MTDYEKAIKAIADLINAMTEDQQTAVWVELDNGEGTSFAHDVAASLLSHDTD
jgi:hypothetical protein